MITPGKVYSVGVVGESHYQAAIKRVSEGERVTLLHDEANKFDPRAIVVLSARKDVIGYLGRGGWLTDALLDEGRGYSAQVQRLQKQANGGPHIAVVLAVTLK